MLEQDTSIWKNKNNYNSFLYQSKLWKLKTKLRWLEENGWIYLGFWNWWKFFQEDDNTECEQETLTNL